MKRLLACVSLLACAACGTQPVLLSVPLNRFESPERSAQFRMGGAIATDNYLILSQDQQTQAPDSSQAQVSDCPEGSGFLFSEESCEPHTSLNVSVRAADLLQLALLNNGGIVTGQAKFYLFGPEDNQAAEGDSSLAFTAAYGRSHDTVGGSPRTRIERSVRDVALILGHRLGKVALLYGGPFFSEHRYKGGYTHVVESQSTDDGGGLLDDLLGDGGTTTSEQEVTDGFGGSLRALGLNLGLRWQFGSHSHHAVLTECAWADFHGDGDPGARGQCGVGLEFGFGD